MFRRQKEALFWAKLKDSITKEATRRFEADVWWGRPSLEKQIQEVKEEVWKQIPEFDTPPDTIYFLVKAMSLFGLTIKAIENELDALEKGEPGYGEDIGHCNGIALMGLQAIMLDAIDTYN